MAAAKSMAPYLDLEDNGPGSLITISLDAETSNLWHWQFSGRTNLLFPIDHRLLLDLLYVVELPTEVSIPHAWRTNFWRARACIVCNLHTAMLQQILWVLLRSCKLHKHTLQRDGALEDQ